jgi:hypothetical protein
VWTSSTIRVFSARKVYSANRVFSGRRVVSLVGYSSRPVTRAQKIVPTVEKAIEVLEANQRKRKKPEWQKY